MLEKNKMTDKKDEIDGLLDSLLDDIEDVDDSEKKEKKSLTPKVIRPKSATIKPVTVQFGSIAKSSQGIKKESNKEKEKSIQEVVLHQKSGDQKPKLKNIERLQLQSEAKRLGIPFEELLKRRGLTDQVKIPPKPKPIETDEDKLLLKKIITKPIVKEIKPKPLPKPDESGPKVYRASIPLSTRDGTFLDAPARIKKIKFTEKLAEDTIGYASPLGFKQKKTESSGFVSIADNFKLEEEKKKIIEPEETELEEDKPFVPNVGGVPLFVDDVGDSEPDEQLVVDETGTLSKAYGLKCPKCGHRFEQIDPERAECTKCGNVFWV